MLLTTGWHIVVLFGMPQATHLLVAGSDRTVRTAGSQAVHGPLPLWSCMFAAICPSLLLTLCLKMCATMVWWAALPGGWL